MYHTQNSLEKNRKTEFLQKNTTLDTKIQIQISPRYLLLINRVAGNMNARVASQSERREENCTGRYSRRLKNQIIGNIL